MLVDRFIPYPDWLSRTIGHPVIWMGGLIGLLEKSLNNPDSSARERKEAGIIMIALVVAVCLAISAFIVMAISDWPYGYVLEAMLASVLLAHNHLAYAVRRVGREMEYSIERGRAAVAHIVGRDTNDLDEPEIARAAIESLAENSSDGVIAPLFWFVLFGLPGIVVYKAINTADSMVGHKNQRFFDFGWASARLDDLVNWLPARLTAVLYALAAGFYPGKTGAMALKTARRDAPNHVSPNAGWPEAALAGALGFGLGGARNYGGKMLELAQMGDGRRDLGSTDIYRALKLFEIMTTIALGLLVLGTLILLPVT